MKDFFKYLQKKDFVKELQKHRFGEYPTAAAVKELKILSANPFSPFWDFISEDLVKLFQHEGKVLRFKAKFAKPKPEVSWCDMFLFPTTREDHIF